MYIAHNLMAANTARNLNAHYANLATSTQRLSTGLRVNAAKDDAAGLAIRELQRAEISALQQGVRNANDAISLLQVADGALAIIDEKLIRMKELAEQGSTGTYSSTQRLMIDSEFQAMAAEIDRIANATDFNGIKLLDGSRQGQHDGSGLNSTGALKIHFGTGNDSAEDYYYIEIGSCTAASLGVGNKSFTVVGEDKEVIKYFDQDGNELEYRKFYWNGGYISNDKHPFIYYSEDQDKDPVWYFPYSNDPVHGSLAYQDKENNLRWNDDDSLIIDHNKIISINEMPNNVLLINYYDNQQKSHVAYIRRLYGTLGRPDIDPPGYRDKEHYISYETEQWIKKSTPIIIGQTIYEETVVDEANVIEQHITYKSEKIYSPGATISSQEAAQKSLVSINNAIVSKDKIRAQLGALSNRLENTVTNLTIQSENLQADESRISDADIAQEMTNFVKNQILAQSAISMLSQANSLPQMVMQLIQ